MTQSRSTSPHADHNAAQGGRQVRHLRTGELATTEAADYGNGTITIDGKVVTACHYQDADGE